MLLDHGRHASLALPAGDGGWLRYAYGDWRYYAQMKTAPWDGMAALLWPTPAALGRRRLPGPTTRAGLRAQLRVGVQAMYPIAVPRGRLERLRRQLQERFRAAAGTPLYNPVYDLRFVREGRRYDLLHNSNQEVARWLRALGCEVHGSALFSRWRVRR